MQMLATADQMREFDRVAIKACGIPGLVLMENAGRAFVDELGRTIGSANGKTVTVVCGKGNNGGDGFVIARHLANRGGRVTVVLLGRMRDVKGDAKVNLDIIRKLAAGKESGIALREIASVPKLRALPHADIVVDALFGTGFSGSVQGLLKSGVDWINQQTGFVASVDIASGVSASDGIVENVAVKAGVTVTMGLPKVGHYVGAGREHSGKTVIADISIPESVIKPSSRQAYRVEMRDVAGAMPKRSLTAHKYSVGRIFVLAGSRGLTGAPYLCSQAAMKAGAGGVILGVPKSIYNPLVRKLAEVMVTPLDETADGSISSESFDVITEKVGWADVVVIGPGLSRNMETQGLVLRLVSGIQKPIVVDADGLNAVATDLSVLKRRKHATILTPHVGELSRLLKQDPEEIELNRVEVAEKASDRLKSIVVLKGSPTVTSVPSGPSYLNSTGNPGMATAGAGDVLTGAIAGLLGQGLIPIESAWCGVYLHGRAGNLAAERFGQRSIMASDILEHLSAAINSLERS